MRVYHTHGSNAKQRQGMKDALNFIVKLYFTNF